MFTDKDTLKYYIVPKEARQDFKSLVNYWLHDMSKGAGFAWIIIEKGSGLFSKDKSCGFFAFEFRDTIQNARISYAVKKEYRGKGIATKITEFVIDTLKSEGVTSIEADIDKDNVHSEKIVKKLGFTTDKRQALIDPEMMRDGEIRIRYLWKKDFILKTLNQNQTKIGRINLNAPQSELIAAINQISNTIETTGKQPNLLAKYFIYLEELNLMKGTMNKRKKHLGNAIW
jgi:RimJ/RimL family protein N-acetyltransferase